jgi:hypothetical protein
MVFGNTANVTALAASTPQVRIHAMRTPRALSLADVTARTRLSVDEVRRFNPALLRRVPAGATLYLPAYVKEFGPDVAFWHRPPDQAFASALNDFVRLEATEEQWADPSFERVLETFQKRFRDTGTEEGAVMATVLAYARDETYSSRRNAILAEFRSSEQVQRLFERGLAERSSTRAAQASAPSAPPADAPR